MTDEIKPTDVSLGANEPPATPPSLLKSEEASTFSPENVSHGSATAPEENTSAGRHNRLYLLPPEVRRELDTLIVQGAGKRILREAMIERFGKKHMFVNVSEATYAHYIRSQRDKILKEKDLEQQVVELSKDTLTASQTTAETLLSDAPFEDKQEVLQRLFNLCQSRLELLKLRQERFVDPHLEAVILAQIKELRSLVQTMVEIQTNLKQDLSTTSSDELEEFTRMLLANVYHAFNLTCKKENFALFEAKLSELLTEACKNYHAFSNRKSSP